MRWPNLQYVETKLMGAEVMSHRRAMEETVNEMIRKKVRLRGRVHRLL